MSTFAQKLACAVATSQERDRKSVEDNAVKKHVLLALADMKSNLPRTHEELIERFRDYFQDQKVEVFSAVITREGEAGFRELIAEAVLQSGYYFRDEDGQIKIRE